MSSKENVEKPQLQRNNEGSEQVHRQVDNAAPAPNKAMLSRSVQRQPAISRAPAATAAPAAKADAKGKRSDLQGAAYYEWIGRNLAYQNQSEGAIIPGPKSGGPESYRVVSVIDDNKADKNPFTKDGSGFYGFSLEPVGAPQGGKAFPGILALRGTEPTAGPGDILTDANPEGIGSNQFAANKARIAAALNHLKTTTGQGAIVCGQSLGGALAQLTTATFTDKVSATYTFNSPGISNKAAGEFEDNKKKMTAAGKGAQIPKVTNYVMEGDKVSIGGETFIGDTKMISTPMSAKEKEMAKQLLGIYEQIKAKANKINELKAQLLSRKIISATKEIAALVKEMYDLIKQGAPLAKEYGMLLYHLHMDTMSNLEQAKNVDRNHTLDPQAEALRKKIGTALDVFRNGLNKIPGFKL